MTEDFNSIYVFVRQDLDLKQQAVQAMHAVDKMRREFGGTKEEHPAIIAVDGGASAKSLERIARKLLSADIWFVTYEDPDFNFGVSAIATVPLGEAQKIFVASYRLWNPKYSPRVPALPQESLASMPSGEPDADVAQLKEHRVFNAEVGGATPSIGSNL